MEDMQAKSKAKTEEKVSPNHSSIKEERNSERCLFQKILGKLNQSSGNPSTRRIPENFRAEESYFPAIVSIGPFHRNYGTKVQIMDDKKYSYMQFFLQRTSSKLEECLERCSAAILNLDSSVRQSYAESIRYGCEHLEAAELAEIMLLDGCFILENFLKYKCRNIFGYTNDPILDDALLFSDLRHDLALLENQIPFFVLETLSDIILVCIPGYDFQGQSSISIIADLALFFFRSADDPFTGHVINFCRFVKSRIEMSRSESYKHLLHLLHDFQVQLLILEPVCYKMNNKQKEERIYEADICATRLLEDGIDFERGTEANLGGLLSITFSKGVIKIPPLHIKRVTDSVLRNLIAFEFEQCSYDSTHHFTSYVTLLNRLIRSSRDIELLQQKRIIIIDWGTAEDVLTLFNRFSREVASKDNCFVNLIYEIQEYRKLYWHWHRQKLIWKLRCQKYLKMLKSDYFSSPWSIISFNAAFVLIVLTGLQTYYTIHSKDGSRCPNP